MPALIVPLSIPGKTAHKTTEHRTSKFTINCKVHKHFQKKWVHTFSFIVKRPSLINTFADYNNFWCHAYIGVSCVF